MLKTTPHFVLASSKSSTYLRGYASGFNSAAASWDRRFEHPPLFCIVTTNERHERSLDERLKLNMAPNCVLAWGRLIVNRYSLIG